MRFALLFAFLAALLLPSAAAAQASPPLLQAQGPDLVYAGQKVILKGTNFDNINALGAGIGTNNVNDVPFTEAHYAELARQGGNHVRLGLSYSWYAGQRAAFFAKMDEQVSFARRHGIFLVFNLFTTPGNCYEGYSDSCGIWGNAGEQNQLIAFWVEMAMRYKTASAVAGYDLLNEPTPPSDCKAWFGIAGRAVAEIRKVTSQLIFINTCSDPGNDLKWNNPPRGANLVYEVHDYSPMDMSHDMFSPGSVYPGTANEWFGSCYVDKNVLATGQGCPELNIRESYGLNWATQQGVPIYIGEWGATSVLKGYVQYTRDKAELYQAWGVNHAHYTWLHQTIKTGGFYQWGIYSSNASVADDPAKLDALKAAFAGAVRPNFDGPSPPAEATATATVPPSATTAPTDTPGPSPAPPTALPTAAATRTPNATQVGRTATALALTTTAVVPSVTSAPATVTVTPATAEALTISVANGRLTIVGSRAGGVTVMMHPAPPADQSVPSFCARQIDSITCWAGLPGTLQLPAPEGLRWAVVRQGGTLRTWVAP